MSDVDYFSDREFTCKCGCGLMNISPKLRYMLNEAREAYGKPIVITSGTRCVKHNKAVGGVPGSSHVTGNAVDIVCNDDGNRSLLIRCLLHAGFNRIGIAKSFIHVDIDPTKNKNKIWVY